jgi:hypothetical protein
VAVYGELEPSEAAQEQLDALDFAEVPLETLSPQSGDQLADWLMESNVVFLI